MEWYNKVILKLLFKNFKTQTKLSDTKQIIKLNCLVSDNFVYVLKFFISSFKITFNSIT